MDMTRRTMIAGSLAMPGLMGAQTAPKPISNSKTLTLTSGALVPAIGMGTWQTFSIDPDGPDLASRKAVLEAFFMAGGGMIDSSPMYGRSEAVIGHLLTELERPDTEFSATKIWTMFADVGPEQLADSRRLWQVPKGRVLDLVHVHNLLNWERHLPMLQAAKRRGEVRYVGLTTSHGRRHNELVRLIGSQDIDAVQFTYNILDREAERYLLPAAFEKGLPVIINRPFQGGALFDKLAHHDLPEWAEEIGASNWAQYFLKFIISHPAVTCAIPATRNPAHMIENMGAIDGPLPDAALRRKMIAYIDSL